jgi:hypothetical protein
MALRVAGEYWSDLQSWRPPLKNILSPKFRGERRLTRFHPIYAQTHEVWRPFGSPLSGISHWADNGADRFPYSRVVPYSLSGSRSRVVFSGVAGAGSQSSACSPCWHGSRLLVPVNALLIVQVLYACLPACQAVQIFFAPG